MLTHLCQPLRSTFAVRETDVSRHNGGTSGAPLKPLRVDSALRVLSSLRGLRGAPAVPPLCRETQSLGQQMLNATAVFLLTEQCLPASNIVGFVSSWKELEATLSATEKLFRYVANWTLPNLSFSFIYFFHHLRTLLNEYFFSSSLLTILTAKYTHFRQHFVITYVIFCDNRILIIIIIIMVLFYLFIQYYAVLKEISIR